MIKRLFFDSAAILLVLAWTLQISCKNGSPTQPKNQSPLIVNLTANPESLDWGGTSQLIVIGTDPDGQDITTSWQTTGGSFLTNTNQDTVTWQAPDSSGSFECTVTLNDGEDAVSQGITLTVNENPLLSKDKDSLIFDTSTTSASFNISNVGTGVLDWTVAARTDDGGNWIQSVAPDSGGLATGNSERITVEVVRLGLAGGQYNGWLKVATDDVDDSLTVSMDVAELAVSESSLNFSTTTTDKSILVKNIGAGSLTWSITENIPWLSASPGSGTLTTDQNVTISVDRTGLADGSYSETLSVQSNGGNRTINVDMTVENPRLNVSPATLDFGTISTNKSVVIQNIGAGSLTWSITENISWLSASPTTGTTDSQQNVNFSVARPGLSPGTYSESFEVQSNGGNKTVTVNMEVEQNVTGRWEQKFNLSGTNFIGYYNLVQNGSTLTGDFVFSDGSGYTTLSSRSYINGRSINMAWWLQSFFIESKGTVSSSWDSMSGTMFANGTAVATWTATRISNSATQTKVSIIRSDNSIAERFNQTLVNSVE